MKSVLFEYFVNIFFFLRMQTREWGERRGVEARKNDGESAMMGVGG